MLIFSPPIVVESDVDGAYESIVKAWFKAKKTIFRSKKVVIRVQPGQPEKVFCERDRHGTLVLLFDGVNRIISMEARREIINTYL